MVKTVIAKQTSAGSAQLAGCWTKHQTSALSKVASETIASASEQRRFLATPSYLRLWFAGGIGNAMRWLELLVAGIFTYEVTQSTVLVALVIVARSLPMLLIGTIAGVVGEALNRKRLLVAQLFILAVSSAVLCVLAFSGQIRVWHVPSGDLSPVSSGRWSWPCADA